jgi:hypothetical protein
LAGSLTGGDLPASVETDDDMVGLQLLVSVSS